MATVTQSYLDGIAEGRATLQITGEAPEGIRSMLRSVTRQHANSRGIAYGALADFMEFRRGEMDFWKNQVARLSA